MFNSKLTKLAAVVALAASGSALAANTAVLSDGTSTAKAVDAGTKETVAYQILAGQTFSDDTNVVAYKANSAGILSGSILQFDFVNGGIEDSTTYVLLNTTTTNDVADIVSTTLIGKTTHTDGYVTQLQLVLGAGISLNDELLLVKAATDGGSNGIDLGSEETKLNLVAAKNLADGDAVSFSARALSSSYVELANTATSSVEYFVADEGFATANITADSQSVDFASDSFEFLDDSDGNTTNYQSLAENFQVSPATLTNGLTLDASDNVTVTVTADACNAVETTDADAVQLGIEGTGYVNLTHSSGCTWSHTGTFATANAGAAILAGTADLKITVNGGAADDTDTAISTANWTYSVSAEINDGAAAATYNVVSNKAFATWSGDVQGGKVTIPYVYTSSSDSSQSYITVGNSNAAATKVAMNVSYTDRSDGSVASYNNYYLGEIAAGSQTTWTAKELVARINAADGAADEGFNTTAQTLDVDALAHMTVELVFQNDTGLDDFEVNAFNRANTARYAVGVSYEGANRSKEK